MYGKWRTTAAARSPRGTSSWPARVPSRASGRYRRLLFPPASCPPSWPAAPPCGCTRRVPVGAAGVHARCVQSGVRRSVAQTNDASDEFSQPPHNTCGGWWTLHTAHQAPPCVAPHAYALHINHNTSRGSSAHTRCGRRCGGGSAGRSLMYHRAVETRPLFDRADRNRTPREQSRANSPLMIKHTRAPSNCPACRGASPAAARQLRLPTATNM